MARFSYFLNDESGATAIEYALISSIVLFAILAGATSIGATLVGFFAAVAKGFN